MKAEEAPKNVHKNIKKFESMFVHNIRLDNVQAEKLREIKSNNLFNNAFGLFRKTNSPTRIATMVAGIWE